MIAASSRRVGRSVDLLGKARRGAMIFVAHPMVSKAVEPTAPATAGFFHLLPAAASAPPGAASRGEDRRQAAPKTVRARAVRGP